MQRKTFPVVLVLLVLLTLLAATAVVQAKEAQTTQNNSPSRSSLPAAPAGPESVASAIQRLTQSADGDVIVSYRAATGMASFIRVSKGGDLMPAGSGQTCLLYTSPSPRDRTRSRMPSSA